MLRILDEKVKRTPEDIKKQYPDCKFLLLDITDIQNVSGYLYCISDSPETFSEICNKRREFFNKGVSGIVMGHYKSGGMIGVQYEVR